MEASLLIKAVHGYIEAFEKGDVNLIRNLYADNAVLEDPVGSPPRRGMAEILAFYEPALKSGMTLKLMGKPRCAGNSVAFMFEGTLPGMRICPIDVFELNEEGKITRMRAYWSMDNVERA